MKPNSESQRSSSVKNEVKNLFRRKSLLERLTPVMGELLSALVKKPASQGKLLPDYCYSIFRALKKAQFRVLPESTQITSNDPAKIDWEALGKVIGAGLRCFRFGQLEMDATLKRENFSEEQMGQLLEIMSALPGFAESLTRPAPPSMERLGRFVKGAEELWAAYLNVSQSAFQNGGGPLAQFTGALQKGVEGFLDRDGHCVVENARDNIYWFLLIIWPEIQEMQQAHPPITRKDFAQWLEPFAAAGFVSIHDFDQLLDICDDIGLKFKGRGAPRKK